MLIRSLRWRLQAWHGLLLVSVLAGFGVTAYQLERGNRFRQIDQELGHRARELGRAMREGGRPDRPRRGPGDDFRPPPPGRGLPPPPHRFQLPSWVETQFGTNQVRNYYYMVWAREGAELARAVEAPAHPCPTDGAVPGGSTGSRTMGEFREAFLITPPGEVLLAGVSLAVDQAEMRRLAGGLVVAGLAVLGLGLAGGWFVATRAIRPITEIGSAARRISAGNLDERVDASRMDDELGQLAEVLNDTFARLGAAFERQRQFTADASHELRTPLTALLWHAQNALTKERAPGEYREALEKCVRSAQRMRRLVESLLELARLESMEAALARESVDLAAVITEALEGVAPLAESRRIRMVTSLETAVTNGDASRLGQVMSNLLVNAVQYNRDEGEVRVSCRTESSAGVVVEVSDTGPGIPAEDLAHVFERFYRVDKSRARGGAGLGLAICQSIVVAHGGRIEVASEAGKGAMFRIRLPG